MINQITKVGVALASLCFMAFMPITQAQDFQIQMRMDRVVVNTTVGSFTLELYTQKAPVTVANFLAYVDDDFYDGLVFHRVLNHRLIQGGGLDHNLQPKPGGEPIENESHNRLTNDKWTLAMARTSDPDSATSQFYINIEDNDMFDRQPGSPGYAVFGKVVEGRYVVSRIAKGETTTRAGMRDVPKELIQILSIERQ